ncbi:hypothetical protein I4U23_008531 [Adineta vaga]|nr:hypothetical protein I4U23_008531 [Adineta vaga]
MALNIFTSTTVWSRLKPSDSRIGEIQCIDISNDSISMSTPFSARINDLYIGTTDGQLRNLLTYPLSLYTLIDAF